MRIFNSGIDWVTLTSKTEGGAGFPLLEIWEELSIVSEEWRAGGYHGLRCIETNLKYGTRYSKDRGEEEILISPGAFSTGVVDCVRFWGRLNCTRIDYQVTVYLEENDCHLASDLYGQIVESIENGMSLVGRRKVSLIQSLTGETLYVGSRKGGRKFFRFYDKSGDYNTEKGLVWRREVQYNRKFANNALREYVSMMKSDRQDGLINLVSSEFEVAMGMGVGFGPYDAVDLIPEEMKNPTGIEQKIGWLKRCVRPTLQKLDDGGYYHEALAALGIVGAKR